MKLEVGMYVRTLKGIAKIIGQNDDVRYYYPNAYVTDTYLNINDDTEYLYEDDILKVSHNIIDLIEVGDYVNGSRVVYFMIDEEKSINEGIDEKIGVVVEEEWEGKKYLTKDIKSIVTKEQFKANEYVFEE